MDRKWAIIITLLLVFGAVVILGTPEITGSHSLGIPAGPPAEDVDENPEMPPLTGITGNTIHVSEEG